MNTSAPAFRAEKTFLYLAYAIVIMTFLLSIIFVAVFQFTGSYVAPTAVFALHILDNHGIGTLPFQVPGYWGVTSVEAEFPVPSLLLSMFIMITGIPKDYAMFTPIVAIASVVYFVLARSVLRDGQSPNAYVLLLSAVFYVFVISTNIQGMYLGRGTFGVVLLAYYLLVYVRVLRDYMSGLTIGVSWFLVLSIFAVAISYTYYTSMLAIGVCTGLMTVVLGVTAYARKAQSSLPMLAITLLAFLLILYGPISVLIGALVPNSNFLGNFLNYIGAILRIEAPNEASALVVGFVYIDLFTRITAIWMPWGLRLTSGVVILSALLLFRPKANVFRSATQPEAIWLLSLIVVFLSFADLAYILVTPVLSLRFLSTYGPLVLLLFGLKLTKRTGLPRISLARVGIARRALVCTLLIVILVSAVGSFGDAWLYTVAKPFANTRIDPLAEFLAFHSSSQRTTNITSDAIYSANLFFVESLYNRTDTVISAPLESSSLTLYHSILTRNMSAFTREMRAAGFGYLIMVNDGRPIFGDEWGYGATLPQTGLENYHFSVVYNDGQCQLLRLS